MSSVRIALSGLLVVSAGLLAGVAGGCRDRVADERDALWQQSQGLQAELDRTRALAGVRFAEARLARATGR